MDVAQDQNDVLRASVVAGFVGFFADGDANNIPALSRFSDRVAANMPGSIRSFADKVFDFGGGARFRVARRFSDRLQRIEFRVLSVG